MAQGATLLLYILSSPVHNLLPEPVILVLYADGRFFTIRQFQTLKRLVHYTTVHGTTGHSRRVSSSWGQLYADSNSSSTRTGAISGFCWISIDWAVFPVETTKNVIRHPLPNRAERRAVLSCTAMYCAALHCTLLRCTLLYSRVYGRCD